MTLLVGDTLADPMQALSLKQARYPEYPLLAHASKYAFDVHSAEIRWLEDRFIENEWRTEANSNKTQIFRNPFRLEYKDDAETIQKKMRGAYTEHLRAIEVTLWDGKIYEGRGYQCMGGVLEYLGRNPLQGDRVELGVLRDMTLLRDRQPNEVNLYHDFPYEDCEFLSEITLKVIPSHVLAVRGEW